MTAIGITERYKQVLRSRAIKTLDSLVTLILGQVVITPIAVIIGLFMHDELMIAGAIALSSFLGLATLYVLRRLTHHIEDL